MCCWLRNSKLVEHKFDAGEDVMWQDQSALVTEVYPVEEGKAESARVEEDDLVPIEVNAYDFVTL